MFHSECKGTLLEYEVCLDEVIKRNQAKNTDSDGFLLGAHLVKLTLLDAMLGIPLMRQTSGEEQTQLVMKSALDEGSEIRRLQKILGIDDQALFDALQIPPKGKIRFEEVLGRYASPHPGQ